MSGRKRAGMCLLLFALVILAAGELVRYLVATATGTTPTLINLCLIGVVFIVVAMSPLLLRLARRKPARLVVSANLISEAVPLDSADQPEPDPNTTIPVLTPELRQSRIIDLYSMAKEE